MALPQCERLSLTLSPLPWGEAPMGSGSEEGVQTDAQHE